MSFIDEYLSGIGVDVSNHHVRIAHMGVFGAIKKLIEIDLPEGLVQDDQVVDGEAVKKIISEKMKKEHLTESPLRTTVLIPESRVFASSFLLPRSMRGIEREAEAIEQAQRDIPIPFEQATVSISYGGREGGSVRTTVYVAEQGVVKGLKQVFDPANTELTALEANSKALLRLFQRFGKSEMQMRESKTLIGLVDIGHAWATISLYTKEGSNLFSRSISYKQDGVRGTVPRLPEKIVDLIHSTLEEVVVYFQEKQWKISAFLFAGVEAEDERFKKDGQTYQMGDVVKIVGRTKKDIHTFGAAIGAALRSVRPYRYAPQHNFLK